MKKTHKTFTKIQVKLSVAFVLSILLLSTISCVKEPTLPAIASLADKTPPSASFSAVVSENYLVYTFSNTSKSATTYAWDFGDGNKSTEKEPMNTYTKEGTFTVTLEASDKLNAKSSTTAEVKVVKPPVPAAIIPKIENGDFTKGQDNWKVSTFTGGTTSPYNSSSDGESKNYDGSSSDAKTPGAKWTGGTSAGASLSGSTRFAYQALTVSAGRDYIVEYSYAIKADKADVDTEGSRLIVEILDGHFSDGADALKSSQAKPITQHIGKEAKGKGNFTLVKHPFTSPTTGLISIWMYGIVDEDAYIDNVKVYPAE